MKMKLPLGLKPNTDYVREHMKFPIFKLRRMIRKQFRPRGDSNP